MLDAGGQSLLLFEKGQGSKPVKDTDLTRDYSRHWTPVHLDFHVDDVGALLDDLARLGGTVEALHHPPDRPPVAFCADPFGHGFCLIGKPLQPDVT